MTEKFRVIQLRENPIAKGSHAGKHRRPKPSGARRRKTSRSRPRRRSKKRAHSSPIARRRGWIVEGLHQKGGRLAFVYWTGKSFSSKRRAAKIYRTEKEANNACHASMKRRAASYRLARVAAA